MSRKQVPGLGTMVNLIGGVVLAWSAPAAAGQHAHNAASTTSWTEHLKGQTIVEDVMEGRPERMVMVERQHHRIMEQMKADAEAQRSGGYYNDVTMMHQYGARNQDVLLMSNPSVEPVSVTGGRCPIAAPVREYDISAINVEITLNMWLDYYPGYTYVLTENIEKVREEELKNREAREQEGYDPGAVRNGLQNQWIQPLVIRGNQGDCVKITLRNQLDGAEEVSLNIHGSSMVVAATGQPATTTNPDSIAPHGKVVDLEWYIPATQQEGGRQFHSYSNDRELTVMGLFGTFVIEPKGSEYLDPLGTGDPVPMKSGWQAIIKNGGGPDFRELVLVEFSGSETLDVFIPSAGGSFRLPGDYVWSNQRLPYAQSGQWGYLRVLPIGDQRIKPLTAAHTGMQQAEMRTADETQPISALRR